jgi:DNA modification methylase
LENSVQGVSWPADRVERWALDKLIPYARNARTHSDAQVAQIAASIREWGWTNPVLVDEGGQIIAGHGRVLAARQLGFAEAPVMVAAGWTDAQKRAYVLADNKLALNAGWDRELLKSELDGLRDMGVDAGLMGFSEEDLMELFGVAKDSGADPDEVPDVQETPVSVVGDVWIMGPHRLAVGDSCDVTVYDRLLEGAQVDAVWTDPPYNVAYEGRAGSIKNDDMNDANFAEFLLAAFTTMYTAMKPGAAIYVAHADTEGLNFRGAFKKAGLKLSGCLIWRKNALVLGRSDYQWQHEPILYGWKPGSKHRWYGGRKQTTVQELGDGSPFTKLPDGRWQIQVGERTMVVSGDAVVEHFVPSVITEAKPRRSDAHPTMKPTPLIERMLKHSARPGDLVLDPFGGSGSTMIAAERMGMCARLIELDPKFADVIVRRWQEYSGRKAVHAATDKVFESLS